MKNPFQTHGLFAVPEDMDALMFNQELYSGSEKAAFTMGMMLTWNYMASQLDKILEEQQQQSDLESQS